MTNCICSFDGKWYMVSCIVPTQTHDKILDLWGICNHSIDSTQLIVHKYPFIVWTNATNNRNEQYVTFISKYARKKKKRRELKNAEKRTKSTYSFFPFFYRCKNAWIMMMLMEFILLSQTAKGNSGVFIVHNNNNSNNNGIWRHKRGMIPKKSEAKTRLDWD